MTKEDRFLSVVQPEPEYVMGLPVTTACNGKCFFCSNDAVPYKLKKVGHRDFNEIVRQIYSTPATFSDPIFMGGSPPVNLKGETPMYGDAYDGSQLSFGETTIHPKFFDILHVIRSRFKKNNITFFTNGSLLTDDFINKLEKYKPLTVLLSLSTTVKENWMTMMGMNEKSFYNALTSVKKLTDRGIIVEPSFTVLPALFGYDDIEKTYKFYSENGVRHVIISSPVYTKFHSPEVQDRMKYDRNELSNFLKGLDKKYPTTYWWNSDPNIPIYRSYNFNKLIPKINELKFQKSYWFSSTAAYDNFKPVLEQMTQGSDCNVIEVENISQGGNVDCAGLWLLSDVENTINKLGLVDQNIVVPKIFLSPTGYDLDGKHIFDSLEILRNKIHII